MSAATPTLDDDEFDPRLVPDLDDDGCLRAMSLLVDIGMSIALELKTPSPDLSPAARIAALERVGTTVRRCILLWKHLSQSKPVDLAIRRAQARRQIIRTVQDTIEQKADPADADSLRLELLERLDAPEFEEDLASRSPAELVAELCRDLGLKIYYGARPDHCRRTPGDVAILHAQAAAPVATLARYLAGQIPHPTAQSPPTTPN